MRPPNLALVFGISITHFWLGESSVVGETSGWPDDLYLAVGAGLLIALD